MFSAVVLTTSSVRTLTLFKLKKEKYEMDYTTVLSLKAMLENREFQGENGKFSGKINGFDYTVNYKLANQKRTYILGDTEASSGNFGAFNILLYTCLLTISKNNSYSQSSFEILKYNKIESHE